MNKILTFTRADSFWIALLVVPLFFGCGLFAGCGFPVGSSPESARGNSPPSTRPSTFSNAGAFSKTGPFSAESSTQDTALPNAATIGARAPGLDGFFAQMARAHPGFGGASVENERLTVYMASNRPSLSASRPTPDLTGRLAKELDLPDRFEKRAPALRRVRHSYDKLVAWRQVARPIVFASPDVHWLDIREQANRIAVGIEPGAVTELRDLTEPLVRKLQEAGLPRSAFQFEETAPPVPMSTLRSRHTPVRGGHQIEFGESSVCTAGFSAYFGGEPAYVTASHCTHVAAAATGTVHSQGGRRIGQEVFDPGRTSALSGCPAGHTCRYSDVAIGVFDTYANLGYATLARPATADPLAGPIHLLQGDATLAVWGEASYPVLGETLHKIGRTTGWTYGEVIATCLDLRVGERVTLLCQDRVEAGVRGGDSGAPVFSVDGMSATDGTTDGTDATLYGVLWGRAGDSFLFSSLYNIREDIRRTGGQPLRLHEPMLRIPEPEPDDGTGDAYIKSN